MNRPLRILHCIGSMHGGGAERQLSYLAGGLVDLGHDVHVAVARLEGPYLERLKRSGATLTPLPQGGRHDPRLIWWLRQSIRALRPDVCHTWLPLMDLAGGLASLTTDVPWILGERCSGPVYASPGGEWLRARLGRRASAIAANSETGSRYWAKQGVPEQRRCVIRNGLAIEEIGSVRAAEGWPFGGKAPEELILAAGRLEPQKNWPVLLDALHQLGAVPGRKALVCGEGNQRQLLENLVGRLGLDSWVTVRGYLPNLWSWMKRASVFVSVSSWEGMPNTVAEAMACGCPLVVSEITGHWEILDDGQAFFVKDRNSTEVARALKNVLENPTAAHTRARLAKKRAQGWDLQQMAEAYAALYESVSAR